jgi:hypothetical protein
MFAPHHSGTAKSRLPTCEAGPTRLPRTRHASGSIRLQGAVRVLPALLALLLHPCASALSGPPWRTDDPATVVYRHWEVYLASTGSVGRQDLEMTAPHVEVNYGVLPDVQLHAVAPFALVDPASGRSQYGYADTEVGAKLRFVHEDAVLPQLGFFPLVLLPTGNEERGLGDGAVQALLPLWIQKSWGAWTTYGGGGYQFRIGDEHRQSWSVGWQVQRTLSESVTIGIEAYHQSAADGEETGSTLINAGAVLDLSAAHHILVSLGRDVEAAHTSVFYLGFQWAFGPPGDQ